MGIFKGKVKPVPFTWSRLCTVKCPSLVSNCNKISRKTISPFCTHVNTNKKTNLEDRGLQIIQPLLKKIHSAITNSFFS